MSATVPGTIPETPICQSASDESKPCEFASHCAETRQRIQSGYVKKDGHWLQLRDTMWGALCWAYQQFRARGVSSGVDPVPAATREPGEDPF